MLDEPRAGARGAARVEIENAGTATWRDDISCSYHWLDPLGNPIYWDGIRTPLPRPVAPEERITLRVDVRAPIPPGRYRFALDLVAEHRAWFAELGEGGPEDELEVRPRVEAAQLWTRSPTSTSRPAGSSPPAPPSSRLPPTPRATPSWRRPSIRRAACAVRSSPGATTPGRDPGFAHPLLCPTVLRGIELERLPDIEGLPAFAPPPDEPWIYDGRVAVRPA